MYWKLGFYILSNIVPPICVSFNPNFFRRLMNFNRKKAVALPSARVYVQRATLLVAVLSALAPAAMAQNSLKSRVPVTDHTWGGSGGLPFPSPKAAHADTCGFWGWSTGRLTMIDSGMTAEMECLDDKGQMAASGVILSRGICPADNTVASAFIGPSGWTSEITMCASGIKNEGPPKCDDVAGNPIHIGTGNKFQAESDYVGGGNDPLRFVRYYNSENAIAFGGIKEYPIWRHSYLRSIVVQPLSPGSIAMAMRPNGKHQVFTDRTGQNSWSPDYDEADQLLGSVGTGFTFIDAANGDRDSFDKDGKLLSIRHKSGVVEQLTYSTDKPPLILSVSNSFGRMITFEYFTSGLLKKMIDPGQGEFLYDYDSLGRLVSVTYPDLKQRRYLYDEPENMAISLPNALTGIIDENNARFATWKYNNDKQAYSSEHGQGVGKVSLSFGSNLIYGSGYTQVTEGQRISSVLGIASNGRYLNSGSDQPAGAGCSASSNAKKYDTQNNLIKSTDFNGGVTTFAYDLGRNLEISRIEAFGTPDARTVSTEWHQQFRSPTKIAEPLRVTSINYFPNELMASESIQATGDANGTQGFAGAPIGPPRKIEYTYTELGQIKTVKGPRTDVEDLTVYEYDNQGNLASVRNPAGQIITYSDYDAHGRPGKIIDPNGIGTEYQYSLRGWVEAQTLRGSAGRAMRTTYEYDGIGQPLRVTLPDQSQIAYGYDDAHRLISVSDKKGNSISYTLDNMGNRISEEVKDATGMLARKITRAYDNLNRVRQVTGSAQ